MIDQFINDAMLLLLAGDDPCLDILRCQYHFSRYDIEYTGVGLYVNFKKACETRLPGKTHFSFGDIEGIVEPSEQEVGFLLWVEERKLSSLEIYLYDGQWPDQIYNYRLHYIDGERDLQSIQKFWT